MGKHTDWMDHAFMKTLLSIILTFLTVTLWAASNPILPNPFTTNSQASADSHVTNGLPVIASTFTGNGGPLTNLSGSNIQIKTRDYVSPLDFGAIGDGITDDTAAFKAAAAYINSSLSTKKRLNLLNISYFITNGFSLSVPHVEVCNGSITIASNATGAIITFSNNCSIGYSINNGCSAHDLRLGRFGDWSTKPDPTLVGIAIGTTNATTYSEDFLAYNVQVTNCAIGIDFYDWPQTHIMHCPVGSNWRYGISSGAFATTAGDGGDESIIDDCDLTSGQYAPPGAASYISTNLIAVFLNGLCIHLRINNVNAGQSQQAIHSTPLNGGTVIIDGGEYEGFRTLNTNQTVFEFWNSVVHFCNTVGIGENGAPFGQSNYLAQIGMYTTNGIPLNLARSSFDVAFGATNLLDVWSSSEVFGQEIGGYSVPLVSPQPQKWSMRYHTTFRDPGNVFVPAGLGTLGTLGLGEYGTNLALLSPDNGTLLIGNSGGSAMVFTSIGNLIGVNGNAQFNAGLTFGTQNGYEWADRGGGQGYLGIYAQNSHRIKLSSTNESNPDLDFSNGVIFAHAPAVFTNSVSAGLFNGNGSGLTNLNAASLTGATNSTIPANTNTIRAWVNFTNVTGGVFKMPLYQ